MSIPAVTEFEQRAHEAESSRVPIFLRIGRAVVWSVYAIVVVIVLVLVLAFLLRLFGASTDAAFTRWVYRNSDSAMRPFRGIFPVRELGNDSVLDISLLFGAVVYTCAAMALDALVTRFQNALRRQESQTATLRAQADQARFQAESQQYAAQAAAQAAGLATTHHVQSAPQRLATDTEATLNDLNRPGL
jgi:uncharacterized protein YggT (Ycf19 family)